MSSEAQYREDTVLNGQSLSVLVNPCTNQPVLYNQIFDPTTSVQNLSRHLLPHAIRKQRLSIEPVQCGGAEADQWLPLPNQTPTSTDVFGYTNNFSLRGQRAERQHDVHDPHRSESYSEEQDFCYL